MRLFLIRIKRRLSVYLAGFKSDRQIVEGTFKYFGLEPPDWLDKT
jgi:hypothetical protein